MSKRKAGSRQITMEFVVGFVFLAAMVVLGFFTIILSNDIFGQHKHERLINFTQVSGVKVGDKVLLRGVHVGQVTAMEIAPDRIDRIQVKVKLDKDYPFHEDYLVEIRNSSVLGGSFVYMELGDASKPAIPKEVVLEGKSPIDVFAEAGKLVGKLNKTMEDISVFTKGLSNTKSSLYKIMNEDRLYEDAVKAFSTLSDSGKKIGSAVDDIKGIVGSVRDTMGEFKAAGKSINDAGKSVKETADSIKVTSDNLNAAIVDARKGKGTVGKLLTDEKLYTDLQGAAKEIRGLVKKASTSKSSIGKLINDDGAMYTSVKSAFDNFDGTMKEAKDVMGKVNRGEGTLGKLINDETVWRDVKQAIKDVQGAIDDFREQAPILTFGSFIFGSL